MNLKIDPEFKALIPRLSAEEREQLEQNIVSADKCRDPLKIWNGLLLDGHNRLEICTKHEIGYEIDEVELEDRLAARIWIRQNQVGRRNLTDDQRAMNAAALAEDISEKEKQERAKKAGLQGGRGNTREKRESLSADVSDKLSEPKRKKGSKDKKDTRKTVAANSKVSERKVRQAQAVRDKAPDLAEKVIGGEMSLAEATRVIKKKDIIENLENVEVREAKAAKGVYDVLVIDPPWPMEKIERDVRPNQSKFDYPTMSEDKLEGLKVPAADDAHVWVWTTHKFLPMALRLIEKWGLKYVCTFVWHKPGGSLLAMVGQSYLPEITQRLSGSLTYHWELAYLTPGGQAVQLWDRKVNTFWKPLLWFVKGKYAGDWIGDVCQSKVNDNDKKHHHWGQSESGMADIIERFTYPGQTICDPFLGGGTTGVVAVEMNRRFIGIDIDAAAVETTKGRLASMETAAEKPPTNRYTKLHGTVQMKKDFDQAVADGKSLAEPFSNFTIRPNYVCLAKLKKCIDLMPDTTCDSLGIAKGSIYSAGSKALLKIRDRIQRAQSEQMMDRYRAMAPKPSVALAA